MANFAVIGVGGYIAPRHLEAIKDLGHQVICAYDKNDSVGILDRFFPDCQFFTDFERFEAFFDKKRLSNEAVDYVAICSPNYLHSAHIKFALSHGAHAICEKPLVLRTSEIQELEDYSKKFNRNVYTVLQLRVHDAIKDLKNQVECSSSKKFQIELDYMTSRGHWYLESWKGDVLRSGGLSTNIGVHFFDMLTWIFGPKQELSVTKKTNTEEAGYLRLESADVRWKLSIDREALPESAIKAGKTTYRSIKIDGKEFEFSEGFTELHKKVYKQILDGEGYGLADAYPAIEIVEKIRETTV